MQAILILTGPPAAGKSVVQGQFESMGVPVIETSDIIRSDARDSDSFDATDSDELWDFVQHQRELFGESYPTSRVSQQLERVESPLVVLGGVRNDAEVNWVETAFSDARVLVARVEAPQFQRIDRHIDAELQGLASSTAELRETADEIIERESREKPYPNHDVNIYNPDEKQVSTLSEELYGLGTALVGEEAISQPRGSV
ncbi:hypothetical protein [Halosegnis longus]|uniref:hypothetical protein n=1 Tax=Halosegnis longus TaxID=2216012 RepID=UPI00129D56F7|nr:hypothetical protein [Halosegnis longus]